jgi:hypothetical protein
VPREASEAHIADQLNRCEFGKTRYVGEECPRTGRVQSNGSLLCGPHAELLRLEVQNSTLLGTVIELDKWLDDPNNRVDEHRWRRVMHERGEVVEQLRSNRTLIEAHKEHDR